MRETQVIQSHEFLGKGKTWNDPSPSFFHGIMRTFLLFPAVVYLGYFSVPLCLCGEEIPRTSASNKNLSSPLITYRGGELTIEAHNSALSDILRAVSARTGAALDFPPAADRPVTGRIGPGQPVDVLARMLKSLDLDYAILGSVAYPKVPVRVILFAKPGSPKTPQPVQGPPPDQESAALSTDVAVDEEASDEAEAQQQQILQRWATIQQDLMERLNARAKQ